MHFGLGHGVVGERPALKQPQKVFLIDGSIYDLEQAGFDILLLAVLDRLEKQVFRKAKEFKV